MTTMANVVKTTGSGGDPSNPLFEDLVTLDLVANYPTGGYTAIAAQLKAVIGTAKTILDVVPLNGKGYVLEYNRTADTLLAYYCGYKTDVAADGPLRQVPNATNLAGVTGIRLLVISQ